MLNGLQCHQSSPLCPSAMSRSSRLSGRRLWLIPSLICTLALGLFGITLAADTDSDLKTALLLADVLRAARTEIASQQALINNEAIGNKGLTGEVVLKNVLKRLEDAGKHNILSNPANNREAELINAQLDSMREIVDENQGLINKNGIGFKGFVPAVFAQLSNERFGEKVGDFAEIKVTAPLDLVLIAKRDQTSGKTMLSNLALDLTTGRVAISFLKRRRASMVLHFGSWCRSIMGTPVCPAMAAHKEKWM